MRSILGLIAFTTFVGIACADSPAGVAELVKQLGDAKFTVREAAQRELIKRGEGIVPELDKLAKGVDAETAERLRKIRYELVGYKDDIRRLLWTVHEGKDSAPVPISPQLRGLIAEHQPGSGNLLLSILADPKQLPYRQALRAFIATWDAATPDQIDKYIQQSVSLTTNHRPQFPAKVDAMISFQAQIRDGWTGWPPIDDNKIKKIFDFRCRATRYLDGKPYEKPNEYPFPFATVGWYNLGELAEGKHTIHAVLEYEFTHRGEKRRGEVRSKESQFEIVSADSPDRLIAAKSEDRFKRVKTALELVRPAAPRESVADTQPIIAAQSTPDEIHVSWEISEGKRSGLSCPRWEIYTPLDVDLCFGVEIHDVKSGKVYAADPIVLPKGERGAGYIIPQDVRAFAKDQDGLVAIKVVRKPSRALALSDPRVTQYFPETVTTDDLRIKVFKTLPPNSPFAK